MSQKVVLVDRDQNTRDILRAAFESRGYTVLDAADGDEGLALVRSEQPAAIVGDFPMDVPGHSPFTRAARDLGVHDAVIVSFSARARPGQVADAEAVSDAVFTKPETPAAIVDRVDELLGR